MEIKLIEGDLLTSKADIIAHQCNAKGIMGSGVAKQIKDKWPEVYQKYRKDILNEIINLGDTQLVTIENNRFIANMIAEATFGYDGKRYTNYEAFYNCLEKLKEKAIVKNKTSIAFPYNIGCCRGGANWNIIKTMIEEVFKDSNFTIEIWKFNKD